MTKFITIHPGEILRTEFLEPLGISPYRLAQELHVTAPRVNDIVLERRGITADMAIRLGRFFNTTPQLWSSLQAEYDRRVASNALSAATIKSIKPFSPPIVHVTTAGARKAERRRSTSAR